MLCQGYESAWPAKPIPLGPTHACFYKTSIVGPIPCVKKLTPVASEIGGQYLRKFHGIIGQHVMGLRGKVQQSGSLKTENRVRKVLGGGAHRLPARLNVSARGSFSFAW